ncbi:MAG: hypothetical protein WDN69_17065 [Aliidongia sp.]
MARTTGTTGMMSDGAPQCRLFGSTWPKGLSIITIRWSGTKTSVATLVSEPVPCMPVTYQVFLISSWLNGM